MSLDDVQVDLRGELDSGGKYVTDEPNVIFEKVTYDVTIKSKASDEQVQALMEHAERTCHASQSLRNPVPVFVKVKLNGKPLPIFR